MASRVNQDQRLEERAASLGLPVDEFAALVRAEMDRMRAGRAASDAAPSPGAEAPAGCQGAAFACHRGRV
ncbi:hypothetical protein FNF29_05177 [Cafeteria roenbergensis]|uniref:Uncharacterized protein n=1 Tax=Cafeteria roenbergensis TaxID=33653 RepID=A0A5A8CCA1_CAFRO|nr:hypothetical protein FNF29_05177 [Cafeteria roenbergensis]|eukprot:KAA0150602.1 hypothetical protein FNF29_05177 [Cafeteria roenbergensis]